VFNPQVDKFSEVSLQNGRMYAPVTTTKRETPAARVLGTRTTFTQSVMVSVRVSKLGVTRLIFVDPGIKVNGA